MIINLCSVNEKPITSHFLLSALSPYLLSLGIFSTLLGCLVFSQPGYADDLTLQSISIRSRLSEQTLLGEDAPEDFEEFDVSALFDLSWNRTLQSDWRVATRLMTSAGLLRGAGENALVVSLIPELTVQSGNGWFTLDLGIGGALISRHRFGIQDFGGPFQFALTLGLTVPLYDKLGIGYRFLHYSDAGLNGSDTIGVDFHMIEFSYRL